MGSDSDVIGFELTPPENHRTITNQTVIQRPREDGRLPSENTSEPISLSERPLKDRKINFLSGNWPTEITKGVLHVYTVDYTIDREEATTLCLQEVPASVTCHAVQAFTAPYHADISHIMMLRDTNSVTSMVLLTFRTQVPAMAFYLNFNANYAKNFFGLSLENLYNIVGVSLVEWVSDPPHRLPLCEMCKERLDESIDTVITMTCNHSFHANCLKLCNHEKCPVCKSQKYVQCPQSKDDRISLLQKDYTVDEIKSIPSLPILSSRELVPGNNFINDLGQNEENGKFVGSEESPSKAESAEETANSTQLHVLPLQSEKILENLASPNEGIRDEILTLESQLLTLKEQLSSMSKEKLAIEKRLTQKTAKLGTRSKELSDLRTYQKALLSKLGILEKENITKNNEIVELKEQVRDLTFFISAENKIEISGERKEIAKGRIIVGEAPKARKGRRKQSVI